jgi:hypothetical protein
MNKIMLVGETKNIYPAHCPVELELRMTEKKSTVSPYLNIDLEPQNEVTEISICGSIWQQNRKDIYAGGQIVDEISNMFPENLKVQRIKEIWERWHLNTMKSGTRKQDEVLDAHKTDHPEWKYSYTEACDILKKAGLYEDRGYKYGHAWLSENPPRSIVEELKELFCVNGMD